MNDEVSLLVNNAKFYGWESVEITDSIESAASSFSLSVSDNDGKSTGTVTAKEGDECAVSIGTDRIITGYVDEANPSIDAAAHTISLSGRSKTSDMVDCSISTAYEYKSRSFLAIAKDLCSTVGVSVSADSKSGASTTIESFKIQPGETIFETLDKKARELGCLLIPSGAGGLVITKPSSVSMGVTLLEGENIKSGQVTFSLKDRYKKYIVLGQGSKKTDFALKGTATDPYVKRSRVLTIVAESKATQSYVTSRAKWEATVRAARACTATIVVTGWKTDSGVLWKKNRLVTIKAPSLRLDGDMLISQVVYRRDSSSGTTTELTLRRKDAFSAEPAITAEPEKKTVSSPTAAAKTNGWICTSVEQKKKTTGK